MSSNNIKRFERASVWLVRKLYSVFPIPCQVEADEYIATLGSGHIDDELDAIELAMPISGHGWYGTEEANQCFFAGGWLAAHEDNLPERFDWTNTISSIEHHIGRPLSDSEVRALKHFGYRPLSDGEKVLLEKKREHRVSTGKFENEQRLMFIHTAEFLKREGYIFYADIERPALAKAIKGAVLTSKGFARLNRRVPGQPEGLIGPLLAAFGRKSAEEGATMTAEALLPAVCSAFMARFLS